MDHEDLAQRNFVDTSFPEGAGEAEAHHDRPDAGQEWSDPPEAEVELARTGMESFAESHHAPASSSVLDPKDGPSSGSEASVSGPEPEVGSVQGQSFTEAELVPEPPGLAEPIERLLPLPVPPQSDAGGEVSQGVADRVPRESDAIEPISEDAKELDARFLALLSALEPDNEAAGAPATSSKTEVGEPASILPWASGHEDEPDDELFFERFESDEAEVAQTDDFDGAGEDSPAASFADTIDIASTYSRVTPDPDESDTDVYTVMPALDTHGGNEQDSALRIWPERCEEPTLPHEVDDDFDVVLASASAEQSEVHDTEIGPSSAAEATAEPADAASVSVPGLIPGFDASSLEVRRIEPTSVAGDHPITYGFVVRNTAPVTLSNVRVEHVLPVGARCIGVSPSPEIRDNLLTWHLGDVAAGAERSFLVRVRKSSRVELPTDTTAVLHASYYLKTSVVRPRLELTMTGPASVRRGELVEFQIRVTNTGTAPAQGLVLRDQIAAGLEHPKGKPIEAELGNLAPGGTIEAALKTTAVRGGTHLSTVTVTSRDGLQANAQANVVVTEAALCVRSSQHVRCPVDSSSTYRIEVSNPGTAPIEQLLLIDTLPEELEFLAASDDGDFDPSDHSITWILTKLLPGQSRTFSVQFTAKLPGDLVHRTLAWSDCGLETSAEATIVSEIDDARSSHLLEELLASIDREDPAVPRPDAPEHAHGETFRGGGLQHIVFTMGDAEYAVPIDNVLEYGHLLGVTPVPNVPDWVLGVANLHGDIVSMVDLRMFLGMERVGYDQDGRLLVVRSRQEDMTVGLIVDRVKGIRVVPKDCVGMPTLPVADRLAPYLRGVAELHGRMLVLLNLDQLLLSPEMRQFEPV